MISKKTIFSVSPLARERGAGVFNSPLLSPLYTASHGLVPYTKDNILAELPLACGVDSEQHHLVEQYAIKFGAMINKSIKDISTFIKPLVNDVALKITPVLKDKDDNRGVNLLLSKLNISYFNLTNPIFKCDFYPTDVVLNGVITYQRASLACFNFLNKIASIDSFATNAYNKIPDRVKEGYIRQDLVTTLKEIKERGIISLLGESASLGGGEVNLDDFLGSKIDDVYLIYLVLKLIKSEESFLNEFNDITLEKLNESLNLSINLLEYFLVNAKTLSANYEVLSHFKVNKDISYYREGEVVLPKGKLLICYTDKAAEELERKDLSLTTVNVGKLLEGKNNAIVSKLNVPEVKEDFYYGTLFENVAKSIKYDSDNYLKEELLNIIKGVIRSHVLSLPSDSSLYRNYVEGDIDGERLEDCLKGFICEIINNGYMSSEEILKFTFSHSLGGSIAQALGLELASRILYLSTITDHFEGVKIVDRRMKLMEGVVDALIGLLLKKD